MPFLSICGMRIRAHTQRSTGKGEQKRKEHASVNTTAVQEAVRAGNEVGYMVPLDLGPAYADPEPRVPRQPERPATHIRSSTPNSCPDPLPCNDCSDSTRCMSSTSSTQSPPNARTRCTGVPC